MYNDNDTQYARWLIAKISILQHTFSSKGEYQTAQCRLPYTPFTRYNRLLNWHDNCVERTATVCSTGCQTGLYNRFDNRVERTAVRSTSCQTALYNRCDNRLYTLYTIQTVVKPVWQQVVSCKWGFRLSLTSDINGVSKKRQNMKVILMKTNIRSQIFICSLWLAAVTDNKHLWRIPTIPCTPIHHLLYCSH